MLADALNVEEKDVLRAVNLYTDSLILLDQYNHQAIVKPNGRAPVYRITYYWSGGSIWSGGCFLYCTSYYHMFQL